MFDISWSEILVIAVLAIVVIGPKDLPKVMRVAGRLMRKARLMAAEFREGVERMAEEVELEEVKKSIHHVSNFDPKRAVETAIDPTGSMVPQPLLTDGEAPKILPPENGKPTSPQKAPSPRKTSVGKAKADQARPRAKASVAGSSAPKGPAAKAPAIKAKTRPVAAKQALVTKKAPVIKKTLARKASAGKAPKAKSGVKP